MRFAFAPLLALLLVVTCLNQGHAAERISVQPASGISANWPRLVVGVSWDAQLILYEAVQTPGNSSSAAYLYLYNGRTHSAVKLADHLVLATLASYGRYVMMTDYFSSSPAILTIIDLVHGTTRHELLPGAVTGNLHTSADGRYITWTGTGDSSLVKPDVNPFYAFWHDTATHETKLVEPLRISDGITISGDGKWVGIFGGTAGNPYNLYLCSPQTHQYIPISTLASETFPGVNAASPGYSIDFGGTFLAYSAYAAPYSRGIQQIHVYNRITGNDELVSTSPNGIGGNSDSTQPTVSNDGRFVAFSSAATNLVPGVTGNTFRIYVCDRWLRKMSLITNASTGEASRSWNSTSALIDANALHVVFDSSPDGLMLNNQYFSGPVNVFESSLPGETTIPILATIVPPHSNG